MPADMILSVRDHPCNPNTLRLLNHAGMPGVVLAACYVVSTPFGSTAQRAAIDRLKDALEAAGRGQ